MMILFPKFGNGFLRNSRNALLLLMMMIFPNFAVAEMMIPYPALLEIERFCRKDKCQRALIKEADITYDGYRVYEVYPFGRITCGVRYCPVIFIFSENGEYKSLDPGLSVEIGSIEWKQSNGKSSPADFVVNMHQDCNPLWVWTGSKYEKNGCVLNKTKEGKK